MAQESRCLGTAILFANIYRIRPNNLPVLPKVDEAEKDFRETFHALGFRTDVYRDLKMEEFYTKLADVKKLAKDKYVVFFFIGHGGDGDVLFMEDGREVETKEVVEGFASLPANTGKVFFIDACRGEGSKDTYCPKLPNSFLARSTLPHQIAHTKGTYGIWSYQLITELRTSMASLEATLKVVAGKVGEQQTQYTNNGLGDICWKTEAKVVSSSPVDHGSNVEDMEMSAPTKAYLGAGKVAPQTTLGPVQPSIPVAKHETQAAAIPPPGGVVGGQVTSTQVVTHASDVIAALGGKADSKWRHFGTFLRFDPTLMDTIQSDHKKSVTDCMLDLVTKWVAEEEGSGDLPRTWQTVVETVRKLKDRKLAEELEKTYGVSTVPPLPRTGTTTGSAGQPQLGTGLRTSETAEFSVSSLKRPPAHEVIPPTRDIEEGTTPKGPSEVAPQTTPGHRQPSRDETQATCVQILKDNAEDFLDKMNAKALVGRLEGISCISAHAATDIRSSKSPTDANSCLLMYMRQDADEKTVKRIFQSAAKQEGQPKMNTFATKMLQLLP